MHCVHSPINRSILRQKEISTWKSTDQFLFLLVYLVSGLFGGLISNECTDNGSVAGREFALRCFANFQFYLFLYGESVLFVFFELFSIRNDLRNIFSAFLSSLEKMRYCGLFYVRPSFSCLPYKKMTTFFFNFFFTAPQR